MRANGCAAACVFIALFIGLYFSAFPAYASESNESASVTILYKDQDEGPEAHHGAMSAMQKSAPDDISQAVLKRGGEVKRRFSSINAISASLPESAIGEIENDPRVLAVERSTAVYAMLQQSVPLVGANTAWQKVIGGMNITGAGTSVCVIDTGVDYTHPDLGGCIGAGCKVIGGYDFVNNDANPIDDHGHGTHVAGIIAANGSGIKGVAPDAKLVAMKVLDANGDGYSNNVESAIDWCIGNSTKYNITAISMSLGDNVSYTSFCDNNAAWRVMANLIDRAVTKNISVVIATGNEGNYAAISAPACIENATRVTATDKNDNYAGFASRSAAFPDILAAPGVSILSDYPGNKRIYLSGTSMATPHVSGAIALLSQAFRAQSGLFPAPAFLGARLNATGKRIPDSATGAEFSRIDVFRALNSIIPPNITQAYNNITKSSSSAISINESEAVFFNASADRDAAYSWYLDNIIQNATGNGFVWQTGYDDSGNWIVRVDASNGYLVSSFQWNVAVLDVPLAIISFYPERESFTGYENSTTALNVTTSRNTNNDIWLIDGITVQGRGKNLSAAWNCTSAGAHNISYIGEDAFDSARMSWTANIADVNCPPYISPPLASPITLQLQNQTAYDISGNVHDDDGDSLVISADDKNITVRGFVLYFNYSVPVANKTVTVFVNDSLLSASAAINVTIIDTIAPKISILSPADNGIYANSSIAMSISSDESLAGCGYLLNNQSYIGIAGCSNATLNATEGWNILTLYANDTVGNSANVTARFFVDSIPPQIYFTPPNSTNESFIFLSALISEAPSSCMLLLDSTVYLMNINSTLCLYNLTGLVPGLHNISIFANDSAGNRNSTGIFSLGANYCVESAGAWSLCQSAKRYRTRILQNCSTIEESEPCVEPSAVENSGNGGWSGEVWRPGSIQIKKQDNNASVKALLAPGKGGEDAKRNMSAPQTPTPNSTGAHANAFAQNDMNDTGGMEQEELQNKTDPLQAIKPAGRAQSIVFEIVSLAAMAFRASLGEMQDTDAGIWPGETAPQDVLLEEGENFQITGAILYGDKIISLGAGSPFQAALRASGKVLLNPLGTALAGMRIFLP